MSQDSIQECAFSSDSLGMLPGMRPGGTGAGCGHWSSCGSCCWSGCQQALMRQSPSGIADRMTLKSMTSRFIGDGMLQLLFDSSSNTLEHEFLRNLCHSIWLLCKSLNPWIEIILKYLFILKKFINIYRCSWASWDLSMLYPLVLLSRLLAMSHTERWKQGMCKLY